MTFACARENHSQLTDRSCSYSHFLPFRSCFSGDFISNLHLSTLHDQRSRISKGFPLIISQFSIINLLESPTRFKPILKHQNHHTSLSDLHSTSSSCSPSKSLGNIAKSCQSRFFLGSFFSITSNDSGLVRFGPFTLLAPVQLFETILLQVRKKCDGSVRRRILRMMDLLGEISISLTNLICLSV